MKKLFSILLLSTLCTSISYAQYNSGHNYPVPTEDLSFLFQPNEFTPFETGDFGNISGQFTQHELYYISLNPANLSKLENNYLYLDYNRASEQEYNAPIYYLANMVSSYVALPPNPVNLDNREPTLSSAFFFRPLETKRLVLGLTYQLLSINEPYYYDNYLYGYYPTQYGPHYLSQDSYPTMLGQRNKLRHQGHFTSLFGSYAVNEDVNIGVKLSYNNYQQNGNQTLDQNNYYGDYLPQIAIAPFDFTGSKNADYSQWDISAGINFKVNDVTHTGISFGYLTGDFDQYSMYTNNRYSFPDQNGNQFSLYNTEEAFNKNGGTFYTSLNLISELSNQTKAEITLKLRNTNFDLGFAEVGRQSNYNEAIEQIDDKDASAKYTYYSNNFYDGSGSNNQWQQDLAITVNHKFSNTFSLTFGTQLNIWSENEEYVQTSESNFRNNREYNFDNPALSDSNYFQRSFSFAKENRSFERYTTSIFVPLIAEINLLKQLNLRTGVVASHHRDILKNSNQYLESTYTNESSDSYYTSTDGIQPVFGNRNSYQQTYLQLIGSIVYSPLDNMNLRFVTTTNKRESVYNVRNTNNFQFRVSMELKF